MGGDTQFLINMGAAQLGPKSSICTDGETHALAAPGPGKGPLIPFPPEAQCVLVAALPSTQESLGGCFLCPGGQGSWDLAGAEGLSDKAQRQLQQRLELSPPSH